ncbi:hypothetical protein WJX77_007853 [Trebouxia sp. C0004]
MGKAGRGPCNKDAVNSLAAAAASTSGTDQIKSSDPDPLDTERFASASDYSKGENITPAKAQLMHRPSLGVRNKG